MKIKQGVFLLLILTVCMTICARAEATLTRFGDVFRQSVTISDDAVYVVVQENGGNVLYTWGYDDAQPQALCALPSVPTAMYQSPYRDLPKDIRAVADEAVQMLATDGRVVYAVNKCAGRIGTVDAKGVTWSSARFGTSILFDASGWERMTSSPFVQDGVLNMLVSYWDEGMDRAHNQKILRVNVQTGRTELWPAPDVREMCAYGDEILMLCTDNSQNNKLLALSPQSGELRELPVGMPKGESIGGLAYDAARGCLYVAGQSALYRSDGTKDFAVYANIKESYVQALGCLPDGRIVMAGAAVSVMSTPAAEGRQSTLTIVENIPSDAVRQAFLREHPDALLDVRVESLTASQVADRIRAGDADVDIYAVKTDGTYGALIDNGYAASLEQSDAIMGSVQEMYPEIRKALADAQGVIRAYPADLFANIQRVNLPLWQKHFGDAPLPATWAELFDAMLRFEQMPDTDGDLFLMNWYYPDMARRVMDDYIKQCADGDKDFASPAFMDTLAALERVQALMQSRGVTRLSEEDAYPESEVIGPRSIIHSDLIGTIQYSLNLDASTLTLAFSPDDAPIVSASMNVYIVNPNSPDQELARAYIAQATKAETGLMRAYLLHESMTQPVKDKRGEEWLISRDAVEAWQSVAQRLRFHIHAPLVSVAMSEQADRLCARYVGGQIGREDLARQLDDVARMVSMEIGQ